MTVAFVDAKIKAYLSSGNPYEQTLVENLRKNRVRLLECVPSAAETETVAKPPCRPRARKQPTQPTRGSARLQQLPKPSYRELKDTPVKRRMSTGSDDEQELSVESLWDQHFETFPATRSKPDVLKASKYLAEQQKTEPSDLRWISDITFEGLVSMWPACCSMYST